MPGVGESVPYRDPGVVRELLDRLLREAAVLDGVIHPAQYPGGVGDGLLAADVRALRAEVGDVRALVERGHFEGAAGAGGGLLEDERDVLAGQPRDLTAVGLRAFEISG